MMPISLSEWRVRIGTYVPRMPLVQYLNLIRMQLFLALLNIFADGESKVDPSEKEMSPTATTDHQSSSDKTPSNPEKDGTPLGVSSDEQKAPSTTADRTKDRLSKGSKKRKRHNLKGRSGPDQSCGAFLSFRCFLKSGASPLLRFLLLVFTTILLLRSGDVELNPGPNESSVSGVSDIMLLNIAEAIGVDDMKITRLGSQLKTSHPDIQMCLAMNRMDGRLTSKGTYQMLVDWRYRTRMQYQQTELREALISSYLQNVADQYLPQDPHSREEASDEVQNIPIHPPAVQSTFTSHGRQNNASSLPVLPMNPNHGANVNTLYQSSYHTTSHQYIHDASSINHGFANPRYQERFQSRPNQHHSVLPRNPIAYQTQGFVGPSHEQNPYAWQSQGQTLPSMQPINVSSSSAQQFLSHGMASLQSSIEAGAVPTGPLRTLNTCPNVQLNTSIVSSHPDGSLYQDPVSNSQLQLPDTCTWESTERGRLTSLYNSPSAGQQLASTRQASSQAHAHSAVLHAPMMTQQEMMQYTFTPENEQGFMSASNQYQEPLYSNLAGLPASEGSLSGQTPSCGMAAAQTYPPTDPGSYPLSMQTGRSYMAPQMTSANPHVPSMSTYHTPQEPTITHSSTAPDVHPASEIPPITDAQLEQCREEIKAFYEVNLCQIPTSPLDTDSLVELKCIFTNLVLLKEDRTTRQKENLAYKDLLNIKINNQTARRIMIQGEAGVGKTTFCAKIAWDWIEGSHYQGYALVAVVPLRDATNDKTVGQILKTYLSDENQVTAEQLDKYIKENQDKVLTVFDGFDEFGVEMCNDMNSIVQILNCMSIKSGTVIVTTRPWKAHEIANGMELAKQYAFVRIEGFKKKDVKTYIRRFYHADETSAKSLQEFIEEGSLVTDAMTPFPIFCSMLCHMWKEVERREAICKLQTFSQLFQEMIMLLKRHYASKHTRAVDGDSVEVIGRQIDDHFQKISKVAFSGLLDKQLVFPEEKFASCSEDLHVACEVGLLTKERAQSKRVHGAVKKLAKKESTVSFPHKLFQEYTAALYLHGLFHSNNKDFKYQMKSKILRKHAEFRYLLYFLGSFDDDIAQYILTKLMTRKRYILDTVVEVALECHSEKAAKLIEVNHKEINRVLTIAKGQRMHVIAGYIFTCKHLVSLCIKTFHNSKALSRILADAVCSLHTLKKLAVSCIIPDAFIQHMQEHAESVMVESLEINQRDYSFSKPASHNLAASICTMPCLKNLKLDMGLSDGFYIKLREGASSLKVECLEIDERDYRHDISESASHNLAASICTMPCLKNLKLARGLSDGFYIKLREGASSLKVESLDLSVGKISKHGSQNLGASICSMPCLRSVKVYSSDISVRLKATLMKDVHLEDSSPPSLPSSSSSSSGVISSACQINIRIDVELLPAFLSSLASSKISKVDSLEITRFEWREISESVSKSLGACICTMPNLKNLKLHLKLSDGFYNAFSKRASSLKIEQMHLMGVRLERSDGLLALALMQNLTSLTLFDIRISDNSKHTEEDGRDPTDSSSSTSLTELNVDHDSFISCGLGLLEMFPRIQKITFAFCDDQDPFPQELLHVTMPAVTDLSLHGYRNVDCASLASLSLVSFPNLINLSLTNIRISNHCKAILESLRNENTLKTISIKNCYTDANLDPLCKEINAEGKMTVTVQHGSTRYKKLYDVFQDIKNGQE